MIKADKIQIKHYSAGIILTLLIFIFYLIGGFKDFSTSHFSNHYSDLLLLGLLLMTIHRLSHKNKSKVDPIFWNLLGAGFLSWFMLSLVKLFFWEELSESKQEIYTSVSYFLFYSLMIAAIEVKAYSRASKFLNRKSLISSLSILVFILGSFSYFIVARDDSDIQVRNTFYFYLLMDGYLALRWIHLSWQSRNSKIYSFGFLILGIASVNWFVADIFELIIQLEKLVHTNENSLSPLPIFLTNIVNSEGLKPNAVVWLDWLWHLPFIIFYLGIKTLSNFNFETSNFDEPLPPKLSRYNLFNTPIFFLGLISLIFLFEPKITHQTDINILINIQLIWISSTFILAMVQVFQLFSNIRKQKQELKNAQHLIINKQKKLTQLQRKLDTQNDANQVLLDTINNPIFTLSSEGAILSVNQAACELLGYEENEIIGTLFTNYIPKTEELSYFFDYQSYRQKLARKDNGLELESKITTQEKKIVEVHVSISQSRSYTNSLIDENDTVFASNNIIVSLADIGKQKQVENQLHQLKDDITANISHEFRTPLTIINGILNDLVSQSQDISNQASSIQANSNQEKLNIAKRNNHRLIHMVDQLLELSKSSNQIMPIIDLNASNWLPLICQSYETIAKEKEISYSISICENIFIRGNQQALENILYNLLSNAFKYTHHKGNVKISLVERQSDYLLEVADNGIGIPTSEQNQVFERFHRVSGESSHKPGVGIGLSLVKSLVSSMNWEISLNSEINQGSTFSIHLTKAISTDFEDEKRYEESTLDQSKESSKNMLFTTDITSKHKSQYLILIIEDNTDMQEYIQSILSPFHQCIVANDGQQGVQMAEEILPDIIISDVMMPKMDGFAVLETIKTQDHTSHIPVILLTAKVDKKSRIKGLSGEADDYLTKPFDSDELVLKITNLLNTRKKLQQKFESQWQGFSQNSTESQNGIENEFLTSLNLLFEQNYTDSSFAMNQLASLLAMSERQLQRKVKALVDVSPLELLKRYRLEKSKIELQGDSQIGLIAQNCGFSSQTYFGRCFKEHFGMTPKAFQKQ